MAAPAVQGDELARDSPRTVVTLESAQFRELHVRRVGVFAQTVAGLVAGLYSIALLFKLTRLNF